MAMPCEDSREELFALVNDLGGELSREVKAISEKYEPQLKQIEDDAPDSGGIDAVVMLDIETEWETITVSLDLPEVVMKLQEWKFDVPQVTMRDKKIIFHTPSTRMVPKKIGQYPVFRGLSVKWKDIIVDVPEFFMQEHKIVMGVPEIRVDTTSVKLHVPEFAMRTQEMKFDVPKITVKNIRAEARKMEDKANELADAMSEEIAEKRQELLDGAGGRITSAGSTLFTCLRTQIQMKRDETSALFEPGIAMVQQALSKLESTGAGAEAERVRGQLAELIGSRDEALRSFDEAIAGIIEQEKTTIEGLLRGLSRQA